MTDLTPYAGRAFDLLAFQGGPGTGLELSQSLAAPGGSGSVVAGVEKLAQRFLLELLTEKGTMTYLPARGCALLTDARAGRWRTSADVQQSYYAALVDVRRNLLAEEAGSEPADERFDSAALLGVLLSGDSVLLKVSLVSRAGTSRVLLPPLPITA